MITYFKNLLLVGALLVFGCAPVFASAPVDEDSTSEARLTTEFFSAPLNGLLHLYRNIFRKGKPPVCQMYPSDSAYAAESVHRHGPVKGILMASDRLQRCGNDLKNYEPIIIEGRPFYSDPVR